MHDSAGIKFLAYKHSGSLIRSTCALHADLDLAAFPPLSRLESTASQRLRAEAYKSASASIKEKYNVSRLGPFENDGGRKPVQD